MAATRIAREIRRNAPHLLMLLPGFAGFLLFAYLPMFGIILAFKRYNFVEGFWRSPWIGLENFRFLFKLDAWYITRNTILYNAGFILLGTVVAVFLAIALHEIRGRRLAKLYESLMLLPWFLSWVIVNYLLYSFLSVDKGLVNRLLASVFGLEPIRWYTEPVYWPPILTGVYLWKTTGYSIVLYLAGIAGINPEYYEAAVLDGAGKLAQIRSITLPMLLPLIMILGLLSLGRIFRSDFGLFYQLPRNSGMLFPVTNVIDTYVIRGIAQTANLGMTAAAALYQSVVGFVLILVSNAIVRRVNPDYALY